MTPAAHSYETCGARNRQGSRCCRRPHPGKRRCWLHGGAPGSGAPKGNRNAVKHGHFTAQQRELRRSLREPNDIDCKLEELMRGILDKRKSRRKKSAAKSRSGAAERAADSGVSRSRPKIEK